MPGIIDRLAHAWNAFKSNNDDFREDIGPSYGTRPDRYKPNFGTQKSLLTAIYTRLAIDVSSVNVRHVRVDQNGSYVDTIPSTLNRCLTEEANIDQTGRAFFYDTTWSLLDEGSVAIVAVDTSVNPSITSAFDVLSLRAGNVVEWYPQHVKINLYNDRTGQKEHIRLPKKEVAIIENPFYSVMNGTNSTLSRLIQKLNLLDAIDNQSGSGKLDLIIQLPYVVKTAARREQAAARSRDIETQLTGSKYGIAYTDSTERITQLNRPVENNLMKQVEYLTSMLYSQLGITATILDGTADEKTMINYHNRTVEPLIMAIIDGLQRRFLTKTAKSQGQAIKYFRNAFGYVLPADLATISDSFTRNAILSSNEVRGLIGFKQSDDPDADKLRNKNLNEAAPIEKEEDLNDETDEGL